MYTAAFGPGWNEAVEATFRICPRCLATMPGRISRVNSVRARTFTWIMSESRDGDISSKYPSPPNPALFTRQSTVQPAVVTASNSD